MDSTVNLKDMFKSIFRRWPLIFAIVVICAIGLNFYGYSKAGNSAQESAELHQQYLEASPNLPEYFTEEMFVLRNRMGDDKAEFCEAFADVYCSYISDSKAGNLMDDTEKFQGYMIFLDSYKEIISGLSTDQREYFFLLAYADREEITSNAAISGEMPVDSGNSADVAAERVSPVQPKWLASGALLGFALSLAALAVPYLLKSGKNRTSTSV